MQLREEVLEIVSMDLKGKKGLVYDCFSRDGKSSTFVFPDASLEATFDILDNRVLTVGFEAGFGKGHEERYAFQDEIAESIRGTLRKHYKEEPGFKPRSIFYDLKTFRLIAQRVNEAQANLGEQINNDHIDGCCYVFDLTARD